MTFAKPEKKQESSMDEMQRLMCSVPGCNKRWSVNMGRPMCSQHQWSGEKPNRNPAALLPKEPKTVAQWYEKENF